MLHSLDFRLSTIGVRNLKEMMQGRIPAHLQQQAIRDYKALLLLFEKEEVLQKKLQPIHDLVNLPATELLDPGRPEKMDRIMGSKHFLDELVEVQRDIANSNWFVAVAGRKRSKKERKVACYMRRDRKKIYVLPNYKDIKKCKGLRFNVRLKPIQPK